MSLELFVSDYTGSTNDRLKQLLAANGATGTTIPDMWLQFLTAEGYTTGALNDRLRQFLLTYTGASDTGQTIDDLWALIDAPYAANTFVLDAWGADAEAAYSTRQLSSAATLSLQAQNDTGTLVEDVGFVDGNLDTGLLTTIFSGDIGKVYTWYDQSTGQEDMTQLTAANRPRIVQFGSINTMPNGKAAPYALSSAIVLSIPNGATNPVLSMFCVFRDTAAADAGRWHLLSNALGTISAFSGGDANTGPGYINGASTVQGASENSDTHILSVTLTGTTATVHLDNASLGTVAGLSDLGPIEKVFNGGADYYIGEVLLFSADMSADRAAITQNMADYWGVTLS